ncbi:MAG: methyltransferase domain-containing protein [Gemmatimonadaceae bacterium]
MTSAAEPRAQRSAADWNSLGVRCPRCLGPLVDAEDAALSCAGCDATYPVYMGIPDLRTGADPYLTQQEDLAAAQTLADRAAGGHDFPALVAAYYAGNDKVPERQVQRFTSGVIAARGRAEATLAAWLHNERKLGTRHPSGALLDVGCGTAPLAIAALQSTAGVIEAAIGVDVGLRWLVLARRRAAEAGVQLPLVCANAEVLPFRDGSAARAGGESILENTGNPAQALHELARVLVPGGRLWLTTPNKYSLGPDPQLGTWAAGLWPQAALRRFAANAGMAWPQRTLFTPRTLHRALERAGFRQIEIVLPDIAAAQRSGQSRMMQSAIDVYHVIKRVPLARRVLRAVGPTLLVTATRV